MKVKRKLKGNSIVLTIRLQSAIEVHLFNQATFVHDSYDTDMSEFEDDKYNKQQHRYGSMNLTIHKSGDVLSTNFFGVIKPKCTPEHANDRTTFQERKIDGYFGDVARGKANNKNAPAPSC